MEAQPYEFGLALCPRCKQMTDCIQAYDIPIFDTA
jgi:hypothetical protein